MNRTPYRTVPRPKKAEPAYEIFLARLILFLVLFALILAVSFAVLFTVLHSGVPLKNRPDSFSDASLSEQSTVLTKIGEAVYEENTPDYGFLSDLSAYEQYMSPTDRDAYLILINVDNPLEQSYVPEDLTDLADTRKDGRAVQQMRFCAAKAMEAMFIELRANGYSDVSVTSAYRSYAYQSSLFNSYIKQYPNLSYEDAYKFVSTFSAIPGTSEHQSGLCADLHNLPSADISFAQKDAAKWLAANCWKFGFILRFPEDKTEITGISFEPWHFRFVGRYHARKIMEGGLCLEEYMSARS